MLQPTARCFPDSPSKMATFLINSEAVRSTSAQATIYPFTDASNKQSRRPRPRTRSRRAMGSVTISSLTATDGRQYGQLPSRRQRRDQHSPEALRHQWWRLQRRDLLAHRRRRCAPPPPPLRRRHLRRHPHRRHPHRRPHHPRRRPRRGRRSSGTPDNFSTSDYLVRAKTAGSDTITLYSHDAR